MIYTSMYRILLISVFVIEFILLSTVKTFAANNIIPGTLIVQPSTLHSLGLEWPVIGDDNRDANVIVTYRSLSSLVWKPGLSMLRKNGEHADTGSFIVPNEFAGSVIDLEPATTYEIKLDMIDPDGGGQSQIITATTKKLFSLTTPLRTLHVYTPDSTGMLQPSYTSLNSAYTAAQAGDLILVHKGYYPMAGSISLSKSATYDRPIVIRGESTEETVLDAGTLPDYPDGFDMFFFNNTHYHIIENLTIKNVDHAMVASGPGSDIIIRNNKILNAKRGINCDLGSGCYNFTVTNNYVKGRFPGWIPREAYYPYQWVGISLRGSGNDISFNTVSRFVDAINSNGYYTPSPSIALHDRAVSNDVYNNYVYELADDCIETDWSEENIRVYRNFCANAFAGLSSQPLYGGPDYFFRNIVYNPLEQSIKPNNRPSGLIYFNNTFVAQAGFFTSDKLWSNSQFINNLFINVDGKDNLPMLTGTSTPETTKIDYNGYRVGVDDLDRPHNWGFMYYSPDGIRLAEFSAWSLAELFSKTGLEQHGITLSNNSYSEFLNYNPPSATDSPVPILDLRLQLTSTAIDKGLVINNITDGFNGPAPDLGAYEVGVPLPFYGYISPDLIPTPTPILGDINYDGKVDLLDYKRLISDYGMTGIPGWIPSDINKDGAVNIFDSNLLVGNFVKTY